MTCNTHNTPIADKRIGCPRCNGERLNAARAARGEVVIIVTDKDGTNNLAASLAAKASKATENPMTWAERERARALGEED